jgi:RES domain-containing protein
LPDAPRVKFEGVAYRALDPRWSFSPASGEGAAVHGGRFNPKGTPALYLALSTAGAIKEASQGFAFKINPLLLCAYDVDCADIVDLRDAAALKAAGAASEDLACGWMSLALSSATPPSWALARRLMGEGAAGVLVPSYAPGATAEDCNLVLWRWSNRRPHLCKVYDPEGRLPKDRRSWPQ